MTERERWIEQERAERGWPSTARTAFVRGPFETQEQIALRIAEMARIAVQAMWPAAPPEAWLTQPQQAQQAATSENSAVGDPCDEMPVYGASQRRSGASEESA